MNGFDDKGRYGHGVRETRRAVEMMRRGASRRDVLQWALALGIAAPVANGLLAGAVRAQDETPKRGGKISVAFNGSSPSDTLDPAEALTSTDYFRMRMHLNSLVRILPDLSWEPELASEVFPNEDASVWTFKLRRDVTFHNGKSFTADDVIYSLNRHLGPDSTSKAKSLVGGIAEVKKIGPYEIEIVLKGPDADLPVLLGTHGFRIVPDGTTDFSLGIGTGPFKLTEFRPGVRAIGVRNEEYWGEGPYLDEIETFGISDDTSRLNAFLAGEVDLMSRLPPDAIERVKATAGREVWSVQSSSYSEFAVRLNQQPYGSLDLVKTMQYLMDRVRVERGVMNGLATMGNDQPIGPAYFDHCAEIPQREQDLDKAKWHFEKTGLGQTQIPISTSDVSVGAVASALILQRAGRQAGINFKVNKLPNEGYWSNVWLKHPIYMGSLNMRPTANIMMTLMYKSDAPWNQTGWHNPQFDQLLVEVRSVIDPEKRKQMYCDLQTMIYETGPSTIYTYKDFTDGVASDIRGLRDVPLGNLGGSEIPEYLWRASA